MGLTREQLQRLQLIYARIPQMLDCKGACYFSCGRVTGAFETAELVRIESAIGHELHQDAPAERRAIEKLVAAYRKLKFKAGATATLTAPVLGYCELLDPDTHLCSIYNIRPAICRLWGAVDSPLMRCPLGCKPSRWLSNKESDEILSELRDLLD